MSLLTPIDMADHRTMTIKEGATQTAIIAEAVLRAILVHLGEEEVHLLITEEEEIPTTETDHEEVLLLATTIITPHLISATVLLLQVTEDHPNPMVGEAAIMVVVASEDSMKVHPVFRCWSGMLPPRRHKMT